MVFALDHADCAAEVVDILTEALTLDETPIPTKVATASRLRQSALLRITACSPAYHYPASSVLVGTLMLERMLR
jgi:hypothetical protein